MCSSCFPGLWPRTGRLGFQVTPCLKLVEVDGFPPIRQKKGEWMGHGGLLPVRDGLVPVWYCS